MEKTPQQWIEEGDQAMSRKDWAAASKAYRLAEKFIDEWMPKVHPLDSERINQFRDWLAALHGNPNVTGRPGRIALAEDYRNRIAGLRKWMEESRIPKGADRQERRQAFPQVRYELAMASLNEAMQKAAKNATDQIIQALPHADRFQVSEVVFGFIAHAFLSVDPDNEEEFLQFPMELPNDPSFESEKRASRSYNSIATQERILAVDKKTKRPLDGHYAKVLMGEFAQALFSEAPLVFAALKKEILKIMDQKEVLSDFDPDQFRAWMDEVGAPSDLEERE